MLLYEFFSAVVCTVVSRAALGYCYSWNISVEGDRMYLNALESQSIPDTDTLSLIYLPNQARSTVRSLAIEVTAQNQSPVEVTQSPSEANNFFILLQSCFKNVPSVYESSQHYPLKENIDLTVITFSTCILRWKGVFYFLMYLVFSYLKENAHLSMITFVHIVSRKSLSIWRKLIPRFVTVTLLLHN